jgi:hypothetical protein
MDLRKYFIVILIILAGSNGICQPIKSGKTSIHINTQKENAAEDILPPSIDVTSPQLEETGILNVTEEDLTLIGTVSDESGVKALFINAEPVSLADGNLFAFKLALEEGMNTVSLLAIDNLGNHTETEYKVEYKPEIIFRGLSSKTRYYALLIGIDEYDDPTIDDLDNPVSDAKKLRNTLVSMYAFDAENVTLKENATREDIIMALDELAGKITPDDNLLVFYAGHGYWDERADIGYWLPADATQMSKAAWFRNSTLCDYLKEIDSRHTLLIADACFGGSIFNTRSAFSDGSKAINMLYELPSRKAMTSGTLTEVPDRSAFSQFLIERLGENQERYLSSEQLFSSFRIAVINNSDVIPQYGQIRNVGDQGGDFIFIRR